MALCMYKKVSDWPTRRSDPSCPWGTNTMWIPDPEVLRAGTNPLPLPGDGGQQQPLRATATIENTEGGDSGARDNSVEEKKKTETGHATGATPTQEEVKSAKEAAAGG
ncbi:hypothetical protein NDU88_007196 [Pleurodeles waltl]|uniref:Uncharacterized protein n=1 Tax=Pleurodeles waltl TaxID=8319 RepID=A0AAV7MFC6_PLEWA|nr:hypothetical protein NDU88_007196 [Pleurodeles waltl]